MRHCRGSRHDARPRSPQQGWWRTLLLSGIHFKAAAPAPGCRGPGSTPTPSMHDGVVAEPLPLALLPLALLLPPLLQLVLPAS